MILVYHLSINREGLQWEGSCDIGLSPVNQQRGVAMGGTVGGAVGDDIEYKGRSILNYCLHLYIAHSSFDWWLMTIISGG